VNRTTINETVRVFGVGLFSASPASIAITPSHPHGQSKPGIIFRCSDAFIPAHISNLSSTPVHPAFAQIKPRCTSIAHGQVNIATVEHILSALAGLGVTDAVIEVQANSPHCEIPIMDGSARDFVNAIQTVGLHTLEELIEPIKILEPICVEDNGSLITIEPADSPSYSYTLDYSDGSSAAPSPIESATVCWTGDPNDYIDRIAPSRTFCLEHEANALTSAGMFEHLSAEDMLVIGDAGPINNEYRHKHECALHKLLDLIGDLSLVGYPLIAKVTAIKSGHALAHSAAAAIVHQTDAQS
jgi:UDP-3-O-acyl N-acetylglucosamine deacetylase